MDLLTYIADMSRRVALAKACDTSPEYLWQIATQWRGKRPSPQLAALIERQTELLGPEKVAKEPMIFGPAASAPAPATRSAQMRALVDSRLTKTGLRRRLALSSDAHLAVLLKVAPTRLEKWAEDEAVPADLVGAVQALLGNEQQTPQQPRPQDPDADRIVTLEVA